MNKRFATIFYLADNVIDDAVNLLDSIKSQDPTFDFSVRKINGNKAIVIFSKNKNQAQKRGKWLVEKTDLFEKKKFTVTLRSERSRPKEAISLQELEKRRKQFGVG